MALNTTRSYRPYHLVDLIADYGGGTSLTNALVALSADISAAGAYKCPQCVGAGRFDKQKQTGLPSDAGIMVEPDPLCDGWGQLVAAPTTIFGVQYEGETPIT